MECEINEWMNEWKGRFGEWNENCKAIGKDININFGLEKHAKICLKKVGSRAKHILEAHLRRTLKNWSWEKHISI